MLQRCTYFIHMYNEQVMKNVHTKTAYVTAQNVLGMQGHYFKGLKLVFVHFVSLLVTLWFKKNFYYLFGLFLHAQIVNCVCIG